MASGNNVVLKYNDYRNGNDKYFVKVPQNSTDKSFSTSSAWVKEAVAINNKGEGDSLHDSVRRVTKSLIKIDEGAVLAALKDGGINV